MISGAAGTFVARFEQNGVLVWLVLLGADGKARERSRREIAARWPLSGARRRQRDTRRRAAPLSNPRPAQPAPPAIRPLARRNELEPQPPAGGCRALARANPLLAVALRARGAHLSSVRSLQQG